MTHHQLFQFIVAANSLGLAALSIGVAVAVRRAQDAAKDVFEVLQTLTGAIDSLSNATSSQSKAAGLVNQILAHHGEILEASHLATSAQQDVLDALVARAVTADV